MSEFLDITGIYWVCSLLIGIWIGVDAYKRKVVLGFAIVLGFFSILLWVIILPFYLAKRNLKKGEMREGGTGWNILKYLILTWTTFLFITGVAFAVEKQDPSAFFGVIIIWFFMMVGALLLGKFLKKDSHTEEGPTGKLKQQNS